MMPFDFVAEVRCFFLFRANSKAYLITRFTPRRVKTVCWTAISSSVPSYRRPPIFEYSPSLFSRTMQKSIWPGFQFFSGVSIPSKSRTGRRLTYCRKVRRMGINNPQSETWSATLGCPTAPRKMASNGRSCRKPSGGIIFPVFTYVSQLQSNSCHLNWNPKRFPAASSTRMPSGTTSFPIPSPAITAMLNIFIGRFSPCIRGEERRQHGDIGSRFQSPDERNYSFSFVLRPINILRAATEFCCCFVKSHRVGRASLAEGGLPGNHSAIFQREFQKGSHFVEACPFRFGVDIKINLPHHRLNIGAAHNLIRKLAESGLALEQ